MKKLIGLVLFLAGGWIFVRGVAAAEVINQFDSQITINSDTSLTIEETIAYQTDEVHHGIYRYIPLKYRVDNLVVEAPVTVLAITDETGQSYQYQSNRENNQLTVKIGDPETTFTGEKTYLIKYRVEEAIKQFEDHDELYWDITGEGWQIPIETVTASVKSPAATLTKAVCYAGPIGNDDGLCQTDLSDQVARFKYEAGINYDRNVTVAVALGRPNQLLFPTATQRLVKQLSNNWFVPMLFVPLLFMAGYWLLNGRDYVFISPNVFNLNPAKPQRRKPIFNGTRVPWVYEPLTDLTPGEAGAIWDEKVDNQDVVAEIIELARKGYLKITREEKKGWFGKTDYVFERLNQDSSKLPQHQQTLLNGLVKTAGETRKISGLKGTFYKTMVAAKQEIETALTQRKLYVLKPNTSRGIGVAIAIGLNVVVFLIIAKALSLVGSFWWYLVFGVQAVIGVGFGLQITQKSAIGSNLAMQARGLRQTIKTGKWREEIKEKHLFIEEILPFAVALGVVDRLAQDMEALNLKPPEYFSSPILTGMTFNSLVSDFSAQASSNLAYNPASHSASGGSGFSGGFSGGGGGGGGGGSW